MRKLCNPHILTALLLTCFGTASAETKVFKNSKNQVTLLELYTSEGCSSCPPADEWLSKTAKSKDAFKTFVPVAFHVDYWNYLGWTDAFSKEKYSKRQRSYAKVWKASSVFTPSIVVNGKKWSGWRKGMELPKTKAMSEASIILKGSGNIWTVGIAKYSGKESLVAHVAILGSDITRKIKGGENKGETLIHDFVALDWQSKSVTKKTKSAKFTLAPIAGFKPKAVVAWVVPAGKAKTLQAVGGML